MKKAALVLVGTPIGNLDDISLRSIRELKNADAICCEDSRRTGKLLAHLQCAPRPPLLVVNEHSEKRRCQEIIDRIQNGERLVMVTDAGMPGIADPGEYIVKKVAESGLTVEVIPGPSAGITALIGSGLSPRRFAFEGFLPRKGASRTTRLQEISTDRRTIILFESPRRLQKTLADLSKYFGPSRRATIARELTKIHEEYHRGTLVQLLDEFSDTAPKGEIVIVIEGGEEKVQSSDDEILHALKLAVQDGLSTRDAVREVSSTLDISKRKVYDLHISTMRNELR